ncbi:reverse transcriptase domain-containing protein [Bacteroides caccae]|uniref:reverse transcriptase domain-containing protein n=1 Tax=Bacteroides caccae TaxID=47678 RepID=UPI00356B0D90
MEDKILKMFFNTDRWVYAIEKGVDKSINKAHLYQLTKPEVRVEMCKAIKQGKYEITPPHTAKIPKDNGDFRTVYINEPIDRVFLSIANDLLFELMPEMVHPSCLSYQKGIGCGKIVKDISCKICETKGEVIGWKSDFSKYFDSVPIRFIDEAFDSVEDKWGHSAIIDVLRKYYHSDWYFDTDGKLQNSYQSLKQGCSVASWLANVVMFKLDERLSTLNGVYVRYSDDALFVGPDYQRAMEIMEEEVMKHDMKLNPKKIEFLAHTRWFKFLGYSIKGADISLSSTRIKTFQKEIEARTIRLRDISLAKAINGVNRYLYGGNGEYSWATQILPVVNVQKDIQTLNMFIMDCLRAVATGKHKIGGLGYVATQSDGCVQRGIGKNVKANRLKTERIIPGYFTIGCMQNAMRVSKSAYKTLVASL